MQRSPDVVTLIGFMYSIPFKLFDKWLCYTSQKIVPVKIDGAFELRVYCYYFALLTLE